MSADDEFRMVSLSRTERDAIASLIASGRGNAVPRDALVAKWDAAPESAWTEIADEFRRHRCKDGNCFAESVLMRLGAITFSPSPLDLPDGAS